MSQTSSAVGVVGLTPPPAFLAVPGAPYQAWSAWTKSFLAFLGATGLDTVSATRKKQILFTMLGVEGQRIVDSFRLDEMPVPEGTDEFSAFLTTLEKHFEFSGSVMLERKKLFDRVQQPGESVTEFLTALRRQSSLCAFGDALDAILCDVFLRGLTSKRVHERMLRDFVDGQLPTLDRAFQLVRQYEHLAAASREYHQENPGTSTLDDAGSRRTESPGASDRSSAADPRGRSLATILLEPRPRWPPWPPARA